MRTVHVAARRDDVATIVRMLPAILSGRVADEHGIASGFKMRLAFAFFSVVKEEFIVKSRGGTDAAGISWPKLSQAYLAYGRGPKSTRTAGGLAPGGNDGFMTAAQLKQWRRDYSSWLGDFNQSYARLSLQVDQRLAKSRAAAYAWAKAKEAGVKTKLDVFGNREVEILRDRGIMFNSLSPGVLSQDGVAASYSASPGQIVDADGAGVLIVGSNVEYTKYHQGTSDKPGRRPIWPVDGELPAEWWEDMLDAAVTGLLEIGEVL